MTSKTAKVHAFARRSPVGLRTSATVLGATASVAAAFVLATPSHAAPIPSGGQVAAARPAAAVAATAATSVGRLTPRGCLGSGTVSCDLYARTGSTQIAGTTIPIWGFASDATTPATAPGPVLVVTQGDAVTITLHNALSNTNVSLALPGQHSVNGGGGDDRTGAAPGGTKAYTFTAGQPGTFLYEAGHTADGARQVAMGLAGALVVLPAAAGTSSGNPAGFPDTSYDDDAPMVLSEIDPALNTSADPLTYDMRSFRPAYRLINGQAFPQTNAVATDQGHKVLVRYVNVGQQMHAMSVLGGSQVELAQDGHPMKYSTTVTAESVDPGMTLDTMVTMPSPSPAGQPAAPTKIAIYEANGALDNNAQVTQDTPARTAFGGMLTFLDTQAPVDLSTDNTGPTSKSVTVSPSPSDALSDVTVTATVSDATTGASNVAAAEYVIDDNDPAGPVAPGSGTPMTLSANNGMTATATGTITASVLANANFASGKHIVYVRGLDAHGNWGAVGSVVLNVPKTGPATTSGTTTPSLTNGSTTLDISATGDDSVAGGTVTAAEFFLDTPGGNGTGTAMTLNRSATVVSVDATFSTAAAGALSEGVHHFWVHVKDSLGLWGPVLDIPLLIDKTGPTTLGAATSPPATNGVLADPSNPGYIQITAEVADPNDALGSNLVAAEAFLANAPAATSYGRGLQLRPIDGKIDSPDEHFYALVPLSQLRAYKDGPLNIYIHGKDAAGNWGDATLSPAVLLIDRVAPVLTGSVASTLTAPGSPGVALKSALTEANTVTAAEYWTAKADPGVGKATSGPVSIVPGSVTVSASFPATAGAVTYHIRVRDAAGNWSNASAVAVTVFRDNLENNGRNFGWSVLTGTGSITTAAAQKNPDETASTKGLQSTIMLNQPTGYVSDNSPVRSSSYHARFQFQAPTLNSGSNTANQVTVFDTRTVDGATKGNEVFGIQFQGSGSNAQIRAVLGTTKGAWKIVGTTNHTIQVDWVGGSSASLVLSVDGTVQYALAANAAGVSIESAQLGVSNSSVPSTKTVGTTGNAWFDTFLSVGN